MNTQNYNEDTQVTLAMVELVLPDKPLADRVKLAFCELIKVTNYDKFKIDFEQIKDNVEKANATTDCIARQGYFKIAARLFLEMYDRRTANISNFPKAP